MMEVLYYKGLNSEYKIILDVEKIERNLERKLDSPYVKINKGLILN